MSEPGTGCPEKTCLPIYLMPSCRVNSEYPLSSLDKRIIKYYPIQEVNKIERTFFLITNYLTIISFESLFYLSIKGTVNEKNQIFTVDSAQPGNRPFKFRFKQLDGGSQENLGTDL